MFRTNHLILKLLLTGLATHQDTINAINNADIDRFIEASLKSGLQ